MLLAVLLALLALIVGGESLLGAEVVAGSAGRALAWGLAPWVGLGLATALGSVAGSSVVAVLVRDLLAGQRGSLRAAWASAWRTLLGILAVGAVLLLAFAAAALVLVPVSIGFLARCGWLARRPETRRQALRGLWLVVPGAASLALLVALPVSWAALLAGRPWRAAVAGAFRQRLLGRLATLGGLLVAVGAVVGLAWCGVRWVDRPDSWGGALALLALSVLDLVVVGAALGVLGHRRGEPPTDVALLERAPVERTPRRGFWGRGRLASVAVIALVSLLAPLAPGVLLATAQATERALSRASALPLGGLVVDTVADAAEPADGECVDPGEPCSLRAALREAAEAGGSVRVRFAVDGRIHLADTLEVPAGTTIEADGHDVTIDAHRDFRAIAVVTAGEGEGEGGSRTVSLQGLTVTGGRSEEGGAGLFSDSTRVWLLEMTFVDNVSGTGPGFLQDGGAVAVPYAALMVDDSTFEDNHAEAGVGGAVAAYQVYWTNSTSVGNTGALGQPAGGAIYAPFGGLVRHATVIGGGGVAGSESGALLTVVNSAVQTVSGNFGCIRITGENDPDSPSVGNVNPEGTCFGTTAPLAPLGPLADNGGATRTVALLDGSAAIGAADAGQCADADQRGVARDPGSCDAGAFETDGGEAPSVGVVLEPLLEPRVGESVELAARATSATGLPAGTMRFRFGSELVASGIAIVDGVARTRVASLPQGARDLTAEFVPDNGDPVTVSEPLRLHVKAFVRTTLSVPPGDHRLHEPVVVTVTVDGYLDEPGIDGPTGRVRFSAGDQTHEAELVDGTASWSLGALEAARVLVEYDGDDVHLGDAAALLVTTHDLATATTATVREDPVTFGDDVVVDVTVRDHVGPARGRARLLVDDEYADEGPLAGGDVTLRASGVGGGDHTIRVVYAPEEGWAASESAEGTVLVDPVGASVVLDAPTERRWDADPLTVTAQVSGPGRAGATVRLLDGTTMLDTAVTDRDGTATFTVPRLTLDAGTHELVAEVVASADVGSARSDVVRLTVTKVPFPLTVTADPLRRVGVPFDVTVRSAEGDLVGDLVLRRAGGGSVLGSQPIDGPSATFPVLPDGAGDLALEVVFTPDPDHPVLRNFQETTKAATFGIDRGSLPNLEMSWGDPVTSQAALTVDFGDVTPAPDGTVWLVHPDAGDLVSAPVVDGVAELMPGGALAGRRLTGLLLRYGGGDDYLPFTTPAPSVQIPSWPTVTTLDDLPVSIGRGEPLPLRVRVTSDYAIPDGQVVFTVNGDNLAPVDLVAGRATTPYVSPVSRDLVVTARYVPPFNTGVYAASSSAAQTVTVSAVPEPTVTLTGPVDGTPLRVGTPVTFTARAVHGSQWIDSGSTVSVVDRQGSVVGSAAWSGFGDWTTSITVTPRHAGAQEFHAAFQFDGFRPGTSPAVALPVTAAVPLLVEAGSPWARIDRPLSVTVALDQNAVDELGLEPVPLEVRLLNYSTPQGDPVVLDESNGFRAVLSVTPTSRLYPLELRAESDGDGASLSRGVSERLSVDVRGEVAAFTFTAPVSQVVQGDVWHSEVSVWAGSGTGPEPTGRVRVRLLDASSSVVRECVLDLPATECSLSTASLPPGRYTSQTVYDGDYLYEPMSSVQSSLTVRAEQAFVELGVDPQPDDWRVGDRVTVTWQTRDTRHDGAGNAPGQVHLLYSVAGVGNSGLLCSARAETGGCAFTVPDYPVPGNGLGRAMGVRYVFLPDSVTSPASGELVARGPLHCLPVRAANALSVPAGVAAPTVSGDAPCSVGGVDGFLEGSFVTVKRADTLPEHYEFTDWDLRSGVDQVTHPAPGSVRFRVVDRAYIDATAAWAPSCVTVTLGDESGNRQYTKDFRDPGVLEFVTPSSCDLPTGESIRERADRERGIGRFIAGTDVQLTVLKWNSSGTVKSPTYQVLDVPGTLPADDTHPGPHVVADRDLTLYPRWRLDPVMCTRMRLYSGQGGLLSVSSATPPAHYLSAPTDGTCTTPSGAPGLLAGTKVGLTATPDLPSAPLATGQGAPFVSRWWRDLDFRSNVVRLGGESVGETGREGPQTIEIEIPVTGGDAEGARYGVRFARVDCVPVQVQVRYPVDYGARTDPGMTRTLGDCPAVIASDAPVASVEQGLAAGRSGSGSSYSQRWRQRVLTSTAWYVRGSRAELTLPYERIASGSWGTYMASDPRRMREATQLQRWEAADNAAFDRSVVAKSSLSWDNERSTVALVVSRPTWLRATYLPAECGVPDVTVTPRRYSYRWDPAVSSGRCPDDQVDPAERITLIADSAPHMRPVWSFDRSSASIFVAGTQDAKGMTFRSPRLTYQESPFLGFTTHQASWRLTYCAPLDVGVEVVDWNGRPLSAAALAKLGADGWGEYADPRAMLTDGGGCPAALMGLENSQQRVGLRPHTAARWTLERATLNGQQVPAGENPVVRVGPDGVTSDRARFTVKPRCFQLSPGDRVVVDTPANCPGGESAARYLAGTAVELHFKGASDKEFDRWERVDASDGEVAVVVMNADRNPVVHWDNLEWYEEAANFLSNITQRAIAALTNVAMAAAGKLLTVGTVASLALGGLADGLESIGLGGAVADGIRQGSEAVDAAVDLASAATSCVSLWATGGASPLVPSIVGQANSGLGGAATLAGQSEAKMNIVADQQVAPGVKGVTNVVSNGINLINSFGAGPDAYFGDARDAWSGIVDIGGCIEPSFNTLASGG